MRLYMHHVALKSKNAFGRTGQFGEKNKFLAITNPYVSRIIRSTADGTMDCNSRPTIKHVLTACQYTPCTPSSVGWTKSFSQFVCNALCIWLSRLSSVDYVTFHRWNISIFHVSVDVCTLHYAHRATQSVDSMSARVNAALTPAARRE